MKAFQNSFFGSFFIETGDFDKCRFPGVSAPESKYQQQGAQNRYIFNFQKQEENRKFTFLKIFQNVMIIKKMTPYEI